MAYSVEESVKAKRQRIARIVLLYAAYSEHGDESRFRSAINACYQKASLERIIRQSNGTTLCAAIVGLGLVGDHSSITILGPLLRHADRNIRCKADEALSAICERTGSEKQREILGIVADHNDEGHFEQAVEMTTTCIDSSIDSVELLHQRSLAFFQLDAIEHAVSDCREILKLHPFHYQAMVGLAHCHLELGDLLEAVFWYRQAVDTYPDLEAVRLKLQRLEKALLDL